MLALSKAFYSNKGSEILKSAQSDIKLRMWWVAYTACTEVISYFHYSKNLLCSLEVTYLQTSCLLLSSFFFSFKCLVSNKSLV